MPNRDELRECPFCGSDDKVELRMYEEHMQDRYSIVCRGCGMDTEGWRDKNSLIKLWNTRPSATQDKSDGWVRCDVMQPEEHEGDAFDDGTEYMTTVYFPASPTEKYKTRLQHYWSDKEIGWIPFGSYTIAWLPNPPPYTPPACQDQAPQSSARTREGGKR